jgi:hypothetical protein
MSTRFAFVSDEHADPPPISIYPTVDGLEWPRWMGSAAAVTTSATPITPMPRRTSKRASRDGPGVWSVASEYASVTDPNGCSILEHLTAPRRVEVGRAGGLRTLSSGSTLGSVGSLRWFRAQNAALPSELE